MKAVLLTLFTIGSLTLLILVIIGRQVIFHQFKFIAAYFFFYSVDNLSIALTNHFQQLQLIPNHLWNDFLICSWSGKLYSILLVLFLLYVFRSILPYNTLGISIQQSKGSLLPALGIILLIVIWSSFAGSHAPKGDFDLRTLVYLAILPGVNEELVYRGVLPACLDKLFPKTWIMASAEIGWSTLITTALFGLLHGLWLDNRLTLHFEIVWVRNALISGFAFAWLRERTGSLVMPVLAHGAWDFFLFLFRMV